MNSRALELVESIIKISWNPFFKRKFLLEEDHSYKWTNVFWLAETILSPFFIYFSVIDFFVERFFLLVEIQMMTIVIFDVLHKVKLLLNRLKLL